MSGETVYFLGAGATKDVVPEAPLNKDIVRNALSEFAETREAKEILLFINTLYHVAIVYSGYIFYIYINGDQIVNIPDIFSDGASTSVFGSNLIGNLNKIRLYTTRAPDRAEVKYIYSNNR